MADNSDHTPNPDEILDASNNGDGHDLIPQDKQGTDIYNIDSIYVI